MANIIKQYRFDNIGSSKNYGFNDNEDPITALTTLKDGSSLYLERKPIIQLGIQALEGTRFYLNNMKEPIIIGGSGIFELKLKGVVEIRTILFDLLSLNAIMQNKNAILIIDVVYLDNN